MGVEEGEIREEVRVSSRTENFNAVGERCSGSCSSSSAGTFSGDDLKCGVDQMVKVELDAARALADFAQLALFESESRNGESGRKWENKGRRSRKRVENDSPARESGRDLENSEIQSSKFRSSDVLQACSIINPRQRKKVRKNILVKTEEVEQDSELPGRSPTCSRSYVAFGGGKSKQCMTEDEKEAQRLRRILANRESARQTICRRQAFCEELTIKAAELTLDNENMKQEKELVMKEYQSLKDRNKHLKAQMAKTIKAEGEETPEGTAATHVETPTSSSTQLPLLVYNRPLFPPFLWPTMIHPLDPVLTQPVPENSRMPKDPMPITCKPNPSHEQGNPPNFSGPRSPFYILPCPWFFPLPDHWNRLLPQPLDSCGLKEKQDETFADNQYDEGSSSEAVGNADNHLQSLPREVKTNANFANNLPKTSIVESQLLEPHPKGVVLMPAPLRSVKCENEFQPHSTSREGAIPSTAGHIENSLQEKVHGSSIYPNKKLVDAAAAAEARKRRKELTKSKNLHGRQLRLHR